jgi:4a-hydroxytetrahydrobiopterin dehydratase
MKPKSAPKIEGKLSRAEIAIALGKLSGWTVAKGKLHREYKFADFVHAFGFMATAAMKIEAMGHHPEWFNVYNSVRVDLTTHDAGGISAKDVELARTLNAIAKRMA